MGLNLFPAVKDFIKNYYLTRSKSNVNLRYEIYVFDRLDCVSLDLGCGKTIKNPFHAKSIYGVDVDYGVNGTTIRPCDLGVERIPFDDNFFDYVTAFDLIEHIPRISHINSERKLPFIFLMSEISRVLKPNGVFLSHTPAFPRLAALSDPTHVNLITVETYKLYFSKPYLWASRYGFVGSFSLIDQFWDGSNLVTILKKSPL